MHAVGGGIGDDFDGHAAIIVSNGEGKKDRRAWTGISKN
jgi:hypothetical protein